MQSFMKAGVVTGRDINDDDFCLRDPVVFYLEDYLWMDLQLDLLRGPDSLL